MSQSQPLYDLEGFTRELARIVCDETPTIPESAVALGKQHLLDTFAVAVAGLNSEAGRIMRTHAARQGGHPEATIFGMNLKSSAESAALVNATLAHIHDYDDDCVVTITHPSAVLVPALFAVAETMGAAARPMVEAYIIGIDVIRRVSDVLGIQHYQRGWHATATLGVLGAAGGCCRLLGLDADRTDHALAIAGSLAGGSIANFGSMTKPLHAGHAAQAGVTAARLAADGFTANNRMLEHPQFGFLKLFGGERLLARDKWKAFGEPYHILDPGVNFKLYPCCAGLHATLHSTLWLTRQYAIHPEAVESAETTVEQMLIDVLANPKPQNGDEAKFSLPYALAVGICRPKAGLDAFLSQTVLDAQIRRLMRRCRLISKQGPSCGAFPVDARVKITLKNGTVYEHTTTAPPGHAQKNPIAGDALCAKVNECCDFSQEKIDASALFETVLNRFEDPADVKTVAQQLSGKP